MKTVFDLFDSNNNYSQFEIIGLKKYGRERSSGRVLCQYRETSLQVLKEPDRDPTDKSYMWLFRQGDPERNKQQRMSPRNSYVISRDRYKLSGQKYRYLGIIKTV